MKDLLVLAPNVSEEGFQVLEEGNVQEAFDSHAAELTVENLKWLTAVSEPENEENPEAVVERFQLTTSTSKKGPQTADDFADHRFELDHFIESFLKFKQVVEFIMVRTAR
jgi:hypothetical protein